MSQLDEMRKVRHVAEDVRDRAAEFLANARVVYDIGDLSHDDLVRVIADKLNMYAEASDHLVATKVAGYILEKTRRGGHASHEAVAFAAEADEAQAVAKELNTLRFGCLDLRLSLDRVIVGLNELKRTMFEARR